MYRPKLCIWLIIFTVVMSIMRRNTIRMGVYYEHTCIGHNSIPMTYIVVPIVGPSYSISLSLFVMLFGR